MIAELPLFIFTILGGLAAGGYAVIACFPKFDDGKRSYLFPLIALILLVIGGVALMFHLGRPERMMYAFLNPAAGIAQEAYAAIALGIVIVIDFIFCLVKKRSSEVLKVIGGIVGLVLVVVMANAYFAYTAVPALASPLTFVFFLLCALGMGAGLITLFPSENVDRKTLILVAGILGLLAALAILIEGIYYAVCGFSIVTFVIGCVFAVVGGICFLVEMRRKAGITLAAVAFGCVFVGVVVARAGFYLAM